MKRIRGENVHVSVDNTGSMISVDWVCPYCHDQNYELVFSNIIVDYLTGFEMDSECEWCNKNVTVECPDYDKD